MVDNAIVLDHLAAIGVDAFAVYGALVCMAGRKGECYPAHPHLAELTGRSVSTVRRAIGTLESAGLIRVDSRNNEGGQTSNLYTILAIGQQPAAATQPRKDEAPKASLFDLVVGAVQDATSHQGKLAALHRGWATVFGPGSGIGPAQMQQLVQSAGGDYTLLARKVLSCAAVPDVKAPFGLVRSSLTRQYPGKAATPRKEAGAVGYGTVTKARQEEDGDLPF